MKLMVLLLLVWISSPIAAAPAQSTLAEENFAPVVDVQGDTDIGLAARYHFATHTGDFDRAREFYRKLGWTEGVGGFPLTNTHQTAPSLGMFDICQ